MSKQDKRKERFIPFEQVKAEVFAQNPEVKRIYDSLEEKYAMIEMFIALRGKSGLSQAEIAERMGTTQSVIARLESGNTFPSLKTLYRYAAAVGMRPVITFERIEPRAS